MLIDNLVNEVKKKKNPCIVGLDSEQDRLPNCYRQLSKSKAKPEIVLQWAKDIVSSFNEDGGHWLVPQEEYCTSIVKMQQEVYDVLKKYCKEMLY